MSAAAGTANDYGGRAPSLSMSQQFNEAATFFGKASVKIALYATSFLVGGYFGSLLFDPFFFPVIHDPSNTTAQAIVGFLQDKFGALHEWIGLTGDGGLLNMPFFETALEPYYPASGAEVMDAFPEGLSFEDLDVLDPAIY